MAEFRRNSYENVANILRNLGGISVKIPAEWVAGSAEWVAGSAVKLGIFSDFWRGATRLRQKSKKMLKSFWRTFGQNFGGMSAEILRHVTSNLTTQLQILNED